VRMCEREQEKEKEREGEKGRERKGLVFGLGNFFAALRMLSFLIDSVWMKKRNQEKESE